MYIGVDIGGSKTLIATFTADCQIIKSHKIPTPKRPEDLVEQVISVIKSLAGQDQPLAVGLAAPGHFQHGKFTNTSTLKWRDVPLESMLQNQLDCPLKVENDAVLGGLAEARIGNGQNCTTLLYITLSTGVGTSIIVDGDVPNFIRGSEGGHMIMNHDDSNTTLESLVSGPAFKRRFGREGYEVDDPNVWEAYSRDLARGLHSMTALIEPDCVVIGGGMALHFDKFYASLMSSLDELNTGVFPLPIIVQAKYPELAVIYGCAIIAREAS